jgi:F-type H+-transporting ATPase subunit gamma
MAGGSKIRKSQALMNATRPYGRMMRRVMGHMSKANPEYRHPFTIEREETKKIGYIIVSTEASAFFKNLKVEIAAHASDLGEKPQIEDLIGSVKVMLDAYREGTLDRLYIVYNDFINTMTHKPTMERLLPLPDTDDEEIRNIWDYIYEPDAESLLDTVLVRYIESQVYQSVLENLASEHAARMIAMKNATDNAGELIDDLTLVFNKARQAAITQEISEIVSGAAAV